jgi:hypothetical protein
MGAGGLAIENADHPRQGPSYTNDPNVGHSLVDARDGCGGVRGPGDGEQLKGAGPGIAAMPQTA